MAITIARYFKFSADWYRRGEVVSLVLEYYVVLRSLLRTKPHLRRCLSRCRHCRIFFLSDPRNAGRRDLRCPLGCRQAHRRKQSTQRSVAYYQGPEGQFKKSLQNAKRPGQSRVTDSLKSAACPQDNNPANVSATSLPCAPTLAQALPQTRDPVLIEHVRVVCSLIEGRRVSRGEVLAMLLKVLRQHSMARRRPIEHVLGWLNARPP